jgi:hypothetical protein
VDDGPELGAVWVSQAGQVRFGPSALQCLVLRVGVYAFHMGVVHVCNLVHLSLHVIVRLASVLELTGGDSVDLNEQAWTGQ